MLLETLHGEQGPVYAEVITFPIAVSHNHAYSLDQKRVKYPSCSCLSGFSTSILIAGKQCQNQNLLSFIVYNYIDHRVLVQLQMNGGTIAIFANV